MISSIPNGAWPTQNQELLLKAALFTGDACRNAWKQWNQHNNVERIDDGSHRLLPLVYHNLCSQGIQDGPLVRLKSVYRYMLTRNHMMFHGIAPVLKAFEDRGIKTMLLKGAALTLTHYRNFGLRPQLDIDVLVPETYASDGIAFLRSNGWRPEYDDTIEKVIQFRHACGFDAGPHKRMDLHWNIFQECREKGIDAVFWQHAVPIKINDVSTHVLSPTHQLLHTCVHGVKWNSVMPCRWVADAIMILNVSQNDINWNDLVDLAQERALTIPLRQALCYLRDTFGAEILEFAMSRLLKAPTSRFEKIEFRIMTARKSALFGNFLKFTVGYARLPKRKNIFLRLYDYISFLQMYWKIRNMASMPFILIREGIKAVSSKRNREGGG